VRGLAVALQGRMPSTVAAVRQQPPSALHCLRRLTTRGFTFMMLVVLPVLAGRLLGSARCANKHSPVWRATASGGASEASSSLGLLARRPGSDQRSD